MANGPMGGFMPTPAAPSQPPPVKLDTTATSRGNFNNFLKSMNGASSMTPLAPSGMGAMMPQVAPSPTSDIDIFNTPVQFMFSGGEIDSFVDEQDSGNNFSGGGNNFDDGFTEEEDPSRAGDYPTDDSGIFTGDSDDNKVPNVNFTNQAIEDAFNTLNIPSKTQKELRDDLQDRAKNNDLIGALDAAQKESAERDKISLDEQVLNSIIQASNVNPATFSRRAFNQDDILGDADILSLADTTKKTSAINQPESAIKSATPTKSIDQILSDMRQKTDLQSQVNQRFRDAGVNIPDVGNIGNINRADLADIIDGNIGIDPSIQARINEQSELDQAPSSNKLGFASNIDPRDETFRNMVESGDRGITEVIDTSPPPTDFEEQVGLPFSDSRMRDIERLLNVPEGQRRAGEGDDPNFLAGIPSALNVFETIPREQMAIDVALGRPRGLGEMFRGVTAPSMFVDEKGRALVSDATGKTVPSSTVRPETFTQYTDRLQRNIIGPEGDTTSFSAKSIPESQLIRNNRGRITAITDASGRTMTGVNPDEQIFDSGDDTPIIRRPIVAAKEEEKEEDKPPNVIGGIDPVNPFVQPTVVASPFAPASSKIDPVSFDSGQLNKLIELLTGVPAKPIVSAAEGGLIRAVDNFLSTGQ